jgi:polysaccharide biosynthesis transport protein
MNSATSLSSSIRQALAVIRRRSWLIVAVFSVLMAAALLVIDKMPHTYQATASVLIVNSRNNPMLSSPDLPSIVGSTEVLERVQRRLGIATPLLTMKKNLVAKPPAYGSGIMRIQYSDSDRDRAAMVANGIADELVRYSSELSTARYDDDLRALDKEIAKQKQRLETINAQLQTHGDEYVPTDLKDDGDPTTPADSLESQRALANANLQGDIAHAQAAAVDANHDVLLADPLYQQLQASLTKASADLADARARYTAQYPGLSAMQDRVDSLKAEMAQEATRALSRSASAGSASPDQLKAQAAVEADRAKVAALDEELAANNQKLSSPVELLSLERDDVLREYQSVAARRATSLADRADALSLGSLEVVDRAIPLEAQTGIGRTRLTLTAAFIIVLIAFGSAFLADQLDPRLRHITQIEGLYGKPLIATLRTSNRDTK